jgi:hypothetical protein
MPCYKATRAKRGTIWPRGDSVASHVSVLTRNGHNRASTSFPTESESEREERARNQTSTTVRDSTASHSEPKPYPAK